jgi:hypothetical protein
MAMLLKRAFGFAQGYSSSVRRRNPVLDPVAGGEFPAWAPPGFLQKFLAPH